MNQRGEGGSTLRSIGLTMLVFAGVLLLFFHRSLNPAQVLFSMDSPLGLLKTSEHIALSQFRAYWMNFNWVGQNMPAAFPNLSNLWFVLTGPLLFAKTYAPLALLVLGFGAWALFRQLKFKLWVCILAGLAAMLATDPFSYACWGLPSVTLSLACVFFALAAVSASTRWPWMTLALGGFAVGISVSEGYDVGAILSLYVAAYTLFRAWVETANRGQGLIKGALRVALVAACAVFIATHVLSTLIGTQIKGITGTQQDAATKQARWDQATQWSLPKIETLRVIIPGLFGYRMDTPEGGNYWGGVGRTPGWEDHKQGLARHSGSGVYAGVLVVLVAIWGFVRSLVARGNPFDDRERKLIWFWAAAALVSLLFSFGRHAPFYQLVYALPYFSTIRNPIKFMHPFSICLVLLFAYGLEGLARQYLAKASVKTGALGAQIKSWWASAPPFEKRWTTGALAVVGASLLAWLLYASSRTELVRHLQAVGFPAEYAPLIARFSFGETGWFVLFLALSVAALVAIACGALAGPRAKLAAAFLGLVLVTDFARANAPWIFYYDYQEKYASNSVLELLRREPHEHRVAGRLSPLMSAYLAQGMDFANIYNEWMQHHFPYYGVQCLDITQMPRMPELDDTYLRALSPKGQANLFPIARLWQLTNTRFQLGMSPFLDLLNQQVDPTNRAFRVWTNFDFAPKQGVLAGGGVSMEDLTTVLGGKGNFAIFEMTNALPRARLFSTWLTKVDDTTALARLADPAFDPWQSVLVTEDAPAPGPSQASAGAGTAQITRYEPKLVEVKTKSPAAGVLLLNDRWHPEWKVWIDGHPASLLRANFIMRGVHVPAGEHTVEFRFQPPTTMLSVSLVAIAIAIGLCGFLAFAPKGRSPDGKG